MATRRERVILDLEDNLTPGLARAAVASRVLKGELNDLGKDSTSASRGLDKVGTSSTRAGRGASAGARDIDKFSGRLRLLVDTAVLLGPALVPLGAAAIPALTGSLVAMGAAAGGIGASVLALKGMGDALKAIDTYQLEPTAENLQAMRIEMEKLGPAGADFARFLDGIEDELKTLQMAARNGLLPGLEDGIDNALERLPGVRKIIREMAEGMGELAASAGADLAPGGGFDAFFRYLDTDGKASLVSFGNAIGDITNGLADMLVAFAPLSRQFTTGFEGMAQSFADWAAGLGESDSFAEFLDYLRINGPRAVDMLGSLAHALADIVTAVAPVGAVTLPILTKFLDLLGLLASSPLGTPFIAAVVGVTAYSRAVAIATAAQAKFNATSKASLAASGPLVAFAALAVAVIEVSDALDHAETAIRGWEDALAAGTLTAAAMKSEIAALKDDLDSDTFGEYLKNSFDPDVWVDFTKRAFGARTEVEHMEAAAALLAGRMEILGAQTRNTGDLADLFGRDIGESGNRMRIAAGDAAELQGALAQLSGWFDKRAAIRNYNASVRELSRSLRNGFTRQDAINLDDIGRNMIQVAEQITNPGKRAAFLEHARDQLDKLAQRGPKAEAAVQKIINKMTALGLIKVEPEVGANTKPAEQKLAKAKRSFDIFDALSGSADLDADAGGFYGVFNPAVSALNSFDGRVATAYVNIKRMGGMGGPGRDEDPGSPTRTSSRSLGRGGEVMSDVRGAGLFGVEVAAKGAAQGLKGLRAELREAERAVSRERRQRDALIARRDEVRGAIASDLNNDLFAVSEASGDPWAAGSTPGGTMDPLAAAQERRDRARRFIAAIRTLKAKGLRGAAMQAIVSEGLEAAEFMAAQSQAYVSEFSATLAEANQYAAQAANMGANAVVSVAEMNAANAELREANKTLRDIEKAIKKAERSNDRGHDRNAERVGDKINGAARNGHRRGKAYAG